MEYKRVISYHASQIPFATSYQRVYLSYFLSQLVKPGWLSLGRGLKSVRLVKKRLHLKYCIDM